MNRSIENNTQWDNYYKRYIRVECEVAAEDKAIQRISPHSSAGIRFLQRRTAESQRQRLAAAITRLCRGADTRNDIVFCDSYPHDATSLALDLAAFPRNWVVSLIVRVLNP